MNETKVEDKNPLDIIDEIDSVKDRISFVTASLVRILVEARHCDETVSGFQLIMENMENDLNKIISALNKKFNLPSDE